MRFANKVQEKKYRKQNSFKYFLNGIKKHICEFSSRRIDQKEVEWVENLEFNLSLQKEKRVDIFCTRKSSRRKRCGKQRCTVLGKSGKISIFLKLTQN